MRTSLSTCIVWLAAAALAVLNGCSSGAAGSPSGFTMQAHGGRGSVESAAGTNALFPRAIVRNIAAPHRSSDAFRFAGPRSGAVAATGFLSDYYNSIVYIYSGPRSIATLSGFYGPQGLATDASGNLYVADTYENSVQVYAPPYNGTPLTLNDPREYPFDVAVDGKGDVAVANNSTTSGGAGGVAFYTPGAINPVSTLSGGPVKEVFFCAFDATGNLYLDGLTADNAFVAGEVVGGINGSAITALTTGNTVQYPGGVAVTESGLIAIDDQFGYAIYTYRPPVGNSLGEPVATTQLGNASDPITFAANGKRLFVADAGLGALTEYALPGGGSPLDVVPLPNSGEPVGVAILP